MNRVCIKIPENVFISFQSGEAKPGTLIENAVLAGYKRSEVKEIVTTDNLLQSRLKYESTEDKTIREQKESASLEINAAKLILVDKYKDKKKSDITTTDANEWNKLRMAEDLGLGL
jgi:hypothetical protein